MGQSGLRAPDIARSGVREIQHGPKTQRKRRTALASQLLARKSIDKLIRDSEEPEHRLKKTLGPWSLTALGIGAVIGSGIFTVIGTAISGEKLSEPSIQGTPLIHYLVTHTILAGRPGAVRRLLFPWCWWLLSARLPACVMPSLPL